MRWLGLIFVALASSASADEASICPVGSRLKILHCERGSFLSCESDDEDVYPYNCSEGGLPQYNPFAEQTNRDNETGHHGHHGHH